MEFLRGVSIVSGILCCSFVIGTILDNIKIYGFLGRLIGGIIVLIMLYFGVILGVVFTVRYII